MRPHEGGPREHRPPEQGGRCSAHARKEGVVLVTQVVSHERHAARKLRARQLGALRVGPQQRHVERGGQAACISDMRSRQGGRSSARRYQIGVKHAAGANAASLMLVALLIRNLLAAVALVAAMLLLVQVRRGAAPSAFAPPFRSGCRGFSSLFPRPGSLALRPLGAPVRRRGGLGFARVLVCDHVELRRDSRAYLRRQRNLGGYDRRGRQAEHGMPRRQVPRRHKTKAHTLDQLRLDAVQRAAQRDDCGEQLAGRSGRIAGGGRCGALHAAAHQARRPLGVSQHGSGAGCAAWTMR